MIELIAFHCANWTTHEGNNVGFASYAAETYFDVIVGKEVLKEFTVAIFPGFPGLFFQTDQVLFEAGLFVGLAFGFKKNKSADKQGSRDEDKSAFHNCMSLSEAQMAAQDLMPINQANSL